MCLFHPCLILVPHHPLNLSYNWDEEMDEEMPAVYVWCNYGAHRKRLAMIYCLGISFMFHVSHSPKADLLTLLFFLLVRFSVQVPEGEPFLPDPLGK